MPKNTINDYVFYKIVCLDNSCNLCYVGSTANFVERRRSHKNSCSNETGKNYNSKIYTTIRANGGWQNFKMVEIGKAEQLTQRQAEQVEEEYRKELRANMNSCRCYLTREDTKEQQQEWYKKNKDKILEQKKQYNLENKDKIKECKKQYYLNNRDKISEQRKQYYENNKDKCLENYKQYRENNRDKIAERKKQYYENNQDKILEYEKQYRENNREKILERKKQYRQDNKEIILKKQCEKITCECGCETTRSHLARHQKTKKHLKLMEVVQK